jgi:lipopolysaccharide biosynthesis protein
MNEFEFDYKYYLETYPDLRHLTKDQALHHWKVHGKNEGRKCKRENNEFDYNYYVESYPDLKNLTREQALHHFKMHGINEGRGCKKKIVNDINNITIIIHLFHENLLDEFLGYINAVGEVFKNVNVIFTLNKNSTLDSKLKSINSNFVILKFENKGVDIYPFLECIKYMRQHFKTDYVLKLHTKVSQNPTENNFEWRKQLIRPLVDYNNLCVLQHYFKTINDIGFVGAQSCCLPKNYDLDCPQNIQGLEELCSTFPHLEKNWTDFIGGTIFWISNNALEQLTNDLITYITNNVNYKDNILCNLTSKKIYIEYVCERLFTGVLCYNKTNILVNEFTCTQRSIGRTNGIVDGTYFYSPRSITLYHPKKMNDLLHD